MTRRAWIRAALVGAVLAATAGAAPAEEPAPHSLDGLDAVSGPIRPGRPDVLAVFTVGVGEALHRDLGLGIGSVFHAGYHVGGGWYLGGGFGVIGTQAEATAALPAGTLFQLQGLLSADWVLPLRGGRDRWGAGPALRLGIAPGVVRAMLQQSPRERQKLKDADLSLDTQLWGAVLRTELALELPVWTSATYRLHGTLGVAYTWGVGQARLRLRDKSGGRPTVRERDNLRLDALSVFVGIVLRY